MLNSARYFRPNQTLPSLQGFKASLQILEKAHLPHNTKIEKSYVQIKIQIAFVN
jgi:hypothetical protein